MTIGCALRRGPWEACYELPECTCARSAVYSRFALLPMHTYRVVFRFCQLEGIDYLVLRYLNTGALPFEEFSEEWLYNGEV